MWGEMSPEPDTCVGFFYSCINLADRFEPLPLLSNSGLKSFLPKTLGLLTTLNMCFAGLVVGKFAFNKPMVFVFTSFIRFVGLSTYFCGIKSASTGSLLIVLTVKARTNPLVSFYSSCCTSVFGETKEWWLFFCLLFNFMSCSSSVRKRFAFSRRAIRLLASISWFFSWIIVYLSLVVYFSGIEETDPTRIISERFLQPSFLIAFTNMFFSLSVDDPLALRLAEFKSVI